MKVCSKVANLPLKVNVKMPFIVHEGMFGGEKVVIQNLATLVAILPGYGICYIIILLFI